MPDTSRYRVLHSLGKGGMGEVFLAEDTQLGRQVAIKFLADGATNDGRALERLYREARSAAALDHPYICKIHEITEVDGRTGIVMEHVSGETLQAELARTPIPPKRALEIAEALDEAHKKRVVHRDLKPANVMLTEQGHVKVMDFGLAKQVTVGSSDDQTTGSLTDPGTRVGTPGYMAPEQLLGSEADERSDIFAFGILLYELLAGIHPFRRSSHSGTMAAILREPHAPVGQYAKDTSETVRVALDRLLAKEPNDRYQSFLDVRTDLRQLQQGAGAVLVTSAAAPSLSGRTPYVGRESERTEARRLLEQAIAGQGGVLLLGGEPGVGKTRLAEEILSEARQRGCLALIGRCYETEGTPPFIPWVEIVERSARIVPQAAFREALGDAAPEMATLVPELRRLFPDIPPPTELPPEQRRRYLFNSFLEFVERAAHVTPQVFLIDDLQWADESTLLLFQHVAQHAPQIPVLIVGTYRDVDLDVQRLFAEMLEALTRQRLAQKMALGRLSQRVVHDMLEALSGQVPPASLVKAIYAETEGNPFFTEEVFHHLLEEGRLFNDDGRWRTDLRVEGLEVPEGVRLVIGRRVKRLSDEARRVLTTAAIVGRSFDRGLLEALGDAKGETLLKALKEAETAKLVLTVSSGREVRWEFAHGLIRQTLEGGLSLPRRQRAHLRVAEALEDVHGARVDRYASDLAHHLYQAGALVDPEKTARFLTLAGNQALDAGAFDEALRQFDDALSILDQEDQRQIAGLRYKKGQALRSLGRWAEAIEEWKYALPVYEGLEDRSGMATVCYEMAHLLVWTARGTEAANVARRGLEVLGPEASADRCRLLASGGFGLGLSAESSAEIMAGDQMLSQSITMAEALADPRAHREALLVSAHQHWFCMRRPEQAKAAQQAADLLRSAGDLWKMAEALALYQMACVFCGRLEGVAQFEEETEPLAQRLGNMGAEMFAAYATFERDWLRAADLDQFEASAQRLVEMCATAVMPWGVFFETCLALASVWRGRWEEARDRAQDTASREPPGFMMGANWSIHFLCECLVGHKQTALALLEARRSHLPRAGRPNTSGAWTMLFGVVEGLTVLRERETAAELYPLTLETIETGAVVSWMPCFHVQTVAGLAAAAGEHWDQAETHYRTALSQAHEIPFRSQEPEVRRWYAQMLLDRGASGDRDKARTLLGEATEMYRTIGMPKHLEMVEKTSAEF